MIEFEYGSYETKDKFSQMVLLNRLLSEEELDSLEDSIVSYTEAYEDYCIEEAIHDMPNAPEIEHWIISPMRSFRIRSKWREYNWLEEVQSPSDQSPLVVNFYTKMATVFCVDEVCGLQKKLGVQIAKTDILHIWQLSRRLLENRNFARFLPLKPKMNPHLWWLISNRPECRHRFVIIANVELK